MIAAWEPYVARRFIRTTLIQDVPFTTRMGTRVYKDQAPDNAVTPYTIMTLVNSGDVVYVGGVRVWTNQLWQIEVWNRTADDAVMAQDAALMDQALNGAKGVMTGPDYGSGVVYATTRERALELPPTIDGDTVWSRAGGEYRLYVQGASA